MSLFKKNGGFEVLNKGFILKKVCFIGDVSVGKTAVVRQFTDYKFEDVYEPTIGANYSSKLVYNDGKYVRLQIWDCAGKETYKTLVETYLENSDVIVVVFDDVFSFQHSKERFLSLKNNPINSKIIFVLNKIDKLTDKFVFIYIKGPINMAVSYRLRPNNSQTKNLSHFLRQALWSEVE